MGRESRGGGGGALQHPKEIKFSVKRRQISCNPQIAQVPEPQSPTPAYTHPHCANVYGGGY